VGGTAVGPPLHFDRRLAQGFEPLLAPIEQSQAGAHDFAGEAVASASDLTLDEPLEVVTQKNAGVFNHDADTPDYRRIPDHGSNGRSDPERARAFLGGKGESGQGRIRFHQPAKTTRAWPLAPSWRIDRRQADGTLDAVSVVSP
jgi:hypothetical protein